MWKNYIHSTIVNVLKHKLHAAINIFGLAIGLASCMLIILYISHETSYDTWVPEVSSLYRIETTAHIPGSSEYGSPNFVGPTKDLLPPDYPEVEEVVRLQQRGAVIIREGEIFNETVTMTDDNFFRVFKLDFVEGDPETALAEPSNIVLTEEVAQKYFGDGPYLGQIFTINDMFEREHKVSAVIRNIPENSHLAIDFLLPIENRLYDLTGSSRGTDLTRWNGLSFYVYIKLRDGTSIEPMRNTINAWVDRYFPADLGALVNISGHELWTPNIVPVADLHLFSPADDDMKASGSITTIMSFAAIAFMILLIACINFMNLATARATLRSREVAVRKVMGAQRKQLFTQFETESLVFSFVALVLAGVLLNIILPYFNEYAGVEVAFALIIEPVTFSSVITLTLLVGLIAGLHPALVLSGTRPATVLMASKSETGASSKLRASLVLLQFTISAVLLIATGLIYFQTEHARNVDFGFDKKNKIILYGFGDNQITENSRETFRRSVAEMPGVTHASLASFGPGNSGANGNSLKVAHEQDRVIMFYRSVDWHFFDMYEVEPMAGRLLSPDFQTDIILVDENDEETPLSFNVVINEMAARRFGFNDPVNALGFSMRRGVNDRITLTVVGVIPNVHFDSPRNELRPLMFYHAPDELNTLNISYQVDDPQALAEDLRTMFRETFPGISTGLAHLEGQFKAQFRAEEVQGNLLGIFSGLAILIACMGLFGLASFSAARRTREIGLRKVMGASSRQIVQLLIRQLSGLVIIGNVIAWPIGWYAMDKWMEGFQHKIDLMPYFLGMAAVSILVTLTIAWVTVGTHAFRVARTNPIYALRNE